jgi:mannan endo-1,4-beta-mannosidase
MRARGVQSSRPVRGLVLLAIAGCATAPAGGAPPACEGKCDEPPVVAAATLRNHLLANLIAQMGQVPVLFGHQRFNITGVNSDGSGWLATLDSFDRSDAQAVVGQHPVVMGFDAWDLAMKPADWAPTPAVHAAAAKHVHARGGIVTMDWHIRGCTNTMSFNAAGNETCLCKLANDDAYARAWLIDANFARLADALLAHGLDRIPIILRPFHELSGDWFWWGQAYWNCDGPITGEAAYQRVYRTVVTYLRNERGLDNLLFAFSPDRFGDGVAGDTPRYLVGYPGDAFVDVMGIDLYFRAQPSFAAEADVFRTYLDTVARAANTHGKAAALTEFGNAKLATDTTPWFTQYVAPLLRDARIAFALTWENRADAYWLPYPGHPLAADFAAFAKTNAALFLDEAPALDQAPSNGYPMCERCDVDPDGDGWGWEHEASCRVGSWCL